MRPDPHKQKASRRYQAKSGESRKIRNEHRIAAIPEQPQFDEPPGDQKTDDAVDFSQHEAKEFLEYLKDESNSISSTNHQQTSNTAFFKLREEIDSEELDKYTEGIWNQLIDVDTGLLVTSLAHSSHETPLNKLLGFKDDLAVEFPVPPPNSNPRQNTTPQQKYATKPLTSSTTIPSTSLAPSLQTNPAPSFKAPKRQEPPRQPAKVQKPADDLEAFLDDIL
ncbi:hypothetical protein EV178_001364 [Coemansia sp. RSA 1646]|nr:hypothetical protein EV178_001364 [Coemansia sp. RSA 1646]